MILPFWNMVVVFINNEWADLEKNDNHVTQILENYIPQSISKTRGDQDTN